MLLRRIERADQHRASEFAGRLADSDLLAPFLKILYRLRYWPRMKDVERPRGGFLTFNDLFSRRLRREARPVADAPLVSAADGRIAACGSIGRGTLLQAKGMTYRLEALLASERGLAGALDGGSFSTVYLSPRDYHRFHAPCDGRLVRVAFVPGTLLPVNRAAVAAVDELFVRNERTLFVLETAWGPVVVVAVAAFLVAGVVVTAAPVPAPRDRRGSVSTHVFHRPATIAKGQELGYFRFGSTVIVLAGPAFPPLLRLESRRPTRVGEAFSEPGEPPAPSIEPRPPAPEAEAFVEAPVPHLEPEPTVAAVGEDPWDDVGRADRAASSPDEPQEEKPPRRRRRRRRRSGPRSGDGGDAQLSLPDVHPPKPVPMPEPEPEGHPPRRRRRRRRRNKGDGSPAGGGD